MKKNSKRLFAIVLAVAMFAALSVGAFAGSRSRTVQYQGYNCACYVSVSKTSASASLDCTLISGQMGPMDPDVAVAVKVFSANGTCIAENYITGVQSASTSASGWSSNYTASSADGTYTFMSADIASLSAIV